MGSLDTDWGIHAVVEVADDEVDNQDQDHTLDPHMDKCYGMGRIFVSEYKLFWLIPN